MTAAHLRSGSVKRIGINASWAPPGQAARMEWYVGNLIKELAALDDRHEWLVVTSPANWHVFELPRRRWKKIAYTGEENSPVSYLVQTADRLPTRRTRLRNALTSLGSPRMRRWSGGLSELVRRHQVGLWFCPSVYALPLDIAVPVVNTVPDLLHEHLPGRFGERELAMRTLGYHDSCMRAATTIGISEFVVEDLMTRYRLERTVGIHVGLDTWYHTETKAAERLVSRVRSKYRLEGPFIYSPSDTSLRTDHETLARAFRLLRQKRRDLRLVFTGPPLDRLRPTFETFYEAGAVRHLGEVDRRDTIGLYSAARAVVFPSPLDGFGVPLLEAMSCGSPIVCSPVASLPEIAGEAALYVDPGDPQALAGAVRRLLEDDVLRGRLIASGRERVQRFRFTETARQTLGVFDEVLAGTWRAPELPPFRPLIGDQWLRDGHSRWYFHCPDLREVRLRIAQPTRLPELAAQRMTVCLNQRLVLETPVEAERDHTFAITPPAADTDFHRLDVAASATSRHRGDALSLQVRELTIAGTDGRPRRLIE